MTPDENLERYLNTYQLRVGKALDALLPSPTTLPMKLHEAMRYVTLGGGKRIRPILVYASGRASGVGDELLDAPACAVELIHTYSLVHDDLPAMDNDDLRRGQPTCHKAYDEATAILVGDALQTLAFHTLSRTAHIQSDIRLQLVEILACASGSRGMAGGQALDLAAVGQNLTLPELENLHIHKTGALISSCLRMGSLLNPELEKERSRALIHFGKCVGLAFQIQDDILDVESDSETLGKTSGKDQAQDKPTYVSLMGLSEAKEKADELLRESLESLHLFGSEADPLRWIAQYIIGRSH